MTSLTSFLSSLSKACCAVVNIALDTRCQVLFSRVSWKTSKMKLTIIVEPRSILIFCFSTMSNYLLAQEFYLHMVCKMSLLSWTYSSRRVISDGQLVLYGIPFHEWARFVPASLSLATILGRLLLDHLICVRAKFWNNYSSESEHLEKSPE